MKRYYETLKTLLTDFVSCKRLTGVGVRAFPRSGPGLFLSDYNVLCSDYTSDLAAVRSSCDLLCLEESYPDHQPETCKNTYSLLDRFSVAHPEVAPETGSPLLVYQDSRDLHDLADRKGWRLMANGYELRSRWENKAFFRKRLKDLGIAVPDGALYSVDELGGDFYRTRSREFGPVFVLQVPDFPRGGGRSTFFVRSGEDFDLATKRLTAGGYPDGFTPRHVLVSRFVKGRSLSMEGCVTPWGVLVTPLQIQLVDLPQVFPPFDGVSAGRFCGHQWSRPEWSSRISDYADTAMRRIGDALSEEGYLGIFGVDFVLSDGSDGEQTLFAVECNPRYTAAFPTLSLMQDALGVPPLEAFHVLSFLYSQNLKPDIPVPPVADINEAYKALNPVLSQVYLYNRSDSAGTIVRDFDGHSRFVCSERCGEVECSPVSHQDETYRLPPPPWNPDEIRLADGPLRKGCEVPPGDRLERIVRVIFFREVLDKNENRLDPYAEKVISHIYGELGLEARNSVRPAEKGAA